MAIVKSLDQVLEYAVKDFSKLTMGTLCIFGRVPSLDDNPVMYGGEYVGGSLGIVVEEAVEVEWLRGERFSSVKYKPYNVSQRVLDVMESRGVTETPIFDHRSLDGWVAIIVSELEAAGIEVYLGPSPEFKLRLDEYNEKHYNPRGSDD